MLEAMPSSLCESALNVFFPSKSICLMMTKVHLSPTMSNADVMGQLQRKSLFIEPNFDVSWTELKYPFNFYLQNESDSVDLRAEQQEQANRT
jgi:hypothetical protein